MLDTQDSPRSDPLDAEVDALVAEILAGGEDNLASAAAQLSAFAAQARGDFVIAYEHRRQSGVSERLSDCDRLRRGEYDALSAAAIAEAGGSTLYFNLLAQKIESAQAWLADAVGPENYKPKLEPTPIPDLPQEAQAILQEELEAFALGQIQSEAASAEDFQDEVTKRLRKAVLEEARERAEAMQEKIDDQFGEGGFQPAFTEFCDHLVTYPTAFLKGPEIRLKKRAKWNGSALEVAAEPIPTWRAPHPKDMYPGPNIATLNQGYLCETVPMELEELRSMKGRPGWNDAEIDAVLEGGQPENAKAYLPDELERAQGENRDTAINSGLAHGMACAVEYWGEARSEFPYTVESVREGVDEFGQPVSETALETALVAKGQQVRAIIVGLHVVYAAPNPDPLGNRPYYGTSYKKIPGTVWGISIPEKGKSSQIAAGACRRNLINNLAMAAGPILFVDKDTYEGPDIDKLKVHPFMVILYSSSKLRHPSQRPIEAWQAQSNAETLIACDDHFSNQMDNDTGIPKYVNGDGDLGGAGGTAAGLSMLISHGSKGLRSVISNVDTDVLRPNLESIYLWNLKYLPDDQFGHLKGDCRVVSVGPIQLMAREIVNLRLNEMLDKSNNPTDQEIFGIFGRAKLWRESLKRVGLPEDIVPSDEEIQGRINQRMQEQAALAMTMSAARGAAARPSPGAAEMNQQPIPSAAAASMQGGDANAQAA
jgi:hypothetical protein